MKIHRYIICGVVVTSISGCGVCTVCTGGLKNVGASIGIF